MIAFRANKSIVIGITSGSHGTGSTTPPSSIPSINLTGPRVINDGAFAYLFGTIATSFRRISAVFVKAPSSHTDPGLSTTRRTASTTAAMHSSMSRRLSKCESASASLATSARIMDVASIFVRSGSPLRIKSRTECACVGSLSVFPPQTKTVLRGLRSRVRSRSTWPRNSIVRSTNGKLYPSKARIGLGLSRRAPLAPGCLQARKAKAYPSRQCLPISASPDETPD